MSLRGKLTAAFIAVAAIGLAIGGVALAINHESATLGQQTVVLAEANAQLSDRNAALSARNTSLAAVNSALLEQAQLYNDLRQELTAAMVKNDDAGSAEGGAQPLTRWSENLLDLFIYNREKPVLPAEKLGLLLFENSPAKLTQAQAERQAKLAAAEAAESTGVSLQSLLGGAEPAAAEEKKTAVTAAKKTEKPAARLNEFLTTGELPRHADTLAGKLSALESGSRAELTQEFTPADADIAKALDEMREPYLRLRQCAARIAELWQPRHVDEHGYDLNEQFGQLRGAHQDWANQLREQVFLGAPITVAVKAEASPIGTWLPSTFARTWRKRWAEFDQAAAAIAVEHSALHQALARLAALKPAQTPERQKLYAAEIESRLQKIDLQFRRIQQAEGTLATLQARARDVLGTEFIPALAAVKQGFHRARAALAKAENRVRGRQESIHAELAQGEATRRADELARLDRERQQLGAIRQLLSRERDAGRLIMFCMAGASLGALGLGIFVSAGIVRRVRRGVQLAHSVRDGHLDGQLDRMGRDEIGQLATALNAMSESLKAKAAVARRIAEGDLTSDVRFASDRDELAGALQQMLVRLRELLGQGTRLAGEVDCGSREIATAGESLSQSAVAQTAAVDQITETIARLDAQARGNAEQAAAADRLATAAREAALAGDGRLGELAGAMNGIRDTGQKVQALVGTIDAIAFQTNLLALNAAIEAARAGRAGKSFAVVAEQVRQLSESCAHSAQESRELVEDMCRRIAAGGDAAGATAEAFTAIRERIGQFSALTGEITATSARQVEDLRQVNSGLGEIGQIAHGVAASSEEVAAATQLLTSQAGAMREHLARFRLQLAAEPAGSGAHHGPDQPARRRAHPVRRLGPALRATGGEAPQPAISDLPAESETEVVEQQTTEAVLARPVESRQV